MERTGGKIGNNLVSSGCSVVGEGRPHECGEKKKWSDLNRTNDLLRVVGVKVTESVK